MSVRLISYTKAVDSLADTLDSPQDVVAFCARISNPSNQMNTETSEKLLKYLIKHKHFSPFEMVSVCMEINTTRDIARQILRHRSFSFQEFSQRYADPTDELSFSIREARLQDRTNRQNSIPLSEESKELDLWWRQAQQELIEKAKQTYQQAIERGMAKEQARAVLPEGLTNSRLLVQGTLRSWIHYVELRSANGTQKEHAEIAKACGCLLADLCPALFQK